MGKKEVQSGRRRRRARDLEAAGTDIAHDIAAPAPTDTIDPDIVDSEPTRFFGRTTDLQALGASFHSGSRLVTILGPPGMGKTRLAIRYLGVWRGREEVGFFCDLRAAQSPRDLCAALAQTLEARFDAGDDQDHGADAIAHVLSAHEPCLVVLDNFEQLVEAASPLVARWLRAVPRLRLLVTSRKALRLEGEYLHDLGPMSLPTETDSGRCEALELFLDRARMAEPIPALDSPAEESIVSKLVTRLEGIPLAIELAAAQVCRATPAEVLRTLDDRRIDLVHVASDVDRRHVTLRHAFDSAWTLLSLSEQRTLTQLSVFCGPFSLDDAQAVVRTGPGEAPAADQVVALRATSWLRVVPGSDRQRWDMFESIREYGRAKLALDADERQATEGRHAAHFLECGEAWARALATTDVVAARSELIRSADDLRFAQRWCLQQPESVWIERAARLALTLHAVLKSWQPMVGADVLSLSINHLGECRDDTGCGQGSHREWLARLLVARAEAFREVGRYAEAQGDLDRGRALEPTSAMLTAERQREEGMLLHRKGHVQRARSTLKRALATAQRLETRFLEARIRCELGYMLSEGMLDPSAAKYFDVALDLYRRIGDVVGEVTVRLHQCMYSIFFRAGPGVEEELESILAESRGLRDRSLETATLLGLGFAAHDREDLDSAQQNYRESRRLAHLAGLRYLEVCACLGEAMVHDDRGKLSQAAESYRSAIQGGRAIKAERMEATARACLSGVLARTDSVQRAEWMLDKAETALLRTGPSGRLDEARIQRAQVHLANARLDRKNGALREARRHEQACRKVIASARSPRSLPGKTSPLPSLEESTLYVRHVLKLVERTATRPIRVADGLRIMKDGSAFDLAGCEAVSLPEGLLQRLLQVFAEQRDSHPGIPIATDTVIDLAWPDEKMRLNPGRMRVRNAVARLRRAGLSALVTRPGGYLLDPDIPFEWHEREAPSTR